MTVSLFKPLDGAAARRPVTVEFNGQPLEVGSEQSVAAALLAAGVSRFRATPVSGAPRAPYCMMGVCFECLLEIDGTASRQACLVQVKEGMRIRTQEGARDWSVEQLEASNGN
jgi:predicted molibdopterin-dependent oxidoreductase YjgC